MRRLRKKNECPPDGFTYTHPETGFTTVAYDPITWVTKAKEHRRANGLSIPDDFEAVMEDQLCNRLHPDLWEVDRGDKTWVDTRLTWNDVVSTAKIFLEWKQQGQPFVSQEEAERRAAICANCHLNVRVPGCGGLCRKVSEIIMETKEKRQTTSDAKLLNCAVCKCPNASQIHFPVAILLEYDNPQRQQQYVAQCWKNRQSPNYLPEK